MAFSVVILKFAYTYNSNNCLDCDKFGKKLETFKKSVFESFTEITKALKSFITKASFYIFHKFYSNNFSITNIESVEN